ncbi:GNAT family N-acetyltransferase [Pleionea sp. CnH1-48]|uniref:GNAT family N-acetyltransferase n=1 Tax=Pleionea sp. CnH1-48 TaxID=2954494 RepID=UPI002097C0B0|nr:GNAT family N-acetyltransferase [Pleionea sp. CnH1-48]MCO7223388.1 GNAT family N-acetyltransferase [Pleionea sp. CnH1-48]
MKNYGVSDEELLGVWYLTWVSEKILIGCAHKFIREKVLAEYQIIEKIIDADNFLRLREISGLSPRPREAAEKALPNSLYCVQVLFDNKPVGMGRVVGDGALNFDIVDIAVDPEHQGRGLGRKIMESVMTYIKGAAVQGSYVCLMADVPELYEKFGFTLSRPQSEGMVWTGIADEKGTIME